MIGQVNGNPGPAEAAGRKPAETAVDYTNAAGFDFENVLAAIFAPPPAEAARPQAEEAAAGKQDSAEARERTELGIKDAPREAVLAREETASAKPRTVQADRQAFEARGREAVGPASTEANRGPAQTGQASEDAGSARETGIGPAPGASQAGLDASAEVKGAQQGAEARNANAPAANATQAEEAAVQSAGQAGAESEAGSDESGSKGRSAQDSPKVKASAGNEAVKAAEAPKAQAASGPTPAANLAPVAGSAPAEAAEAAKAQGRGAAQSQVQQLGRVEASGSSATSVATARAERESEAGLRGTEVRSVVRANQRAMIEKVMAAVRAAQHGSGKARLLLSPPNLGTVKVEIEVKKGEAHASLKAETIEAKNLLLAHASELRESLAGRGLELASFTVTVEDEGPGADSHAQGGGRESGGETADENLNSTADPARESLLETVA